MNRRSLLRSFLGIPLGATALTVLPKKEEVSLTWEGTEVFRVVKKRTSDHATDSMRHVFVWNGEGGVLRRIET